MAPPRRLRGVHLVLGASFAFVLGASSVHCGSAGNGATQGSGGNGGGINGSSGASMGQGGDITIDVVTKDYSAEDFFDNDPPPKSCDGGGKPPPAPGGTPECPDDKNLEGCSCPAAGATAACWPGLRKNRNHGICHDGMTTCQLTGENDLAWGPCVGAQLPNAMTGKGACGCFSGGHWAIANLSPCFFTMNGTTVAVSTVVQGGMPVCPPDANAPPPQPWSTDTLQVDCTGNFKLCYTIKAGDGKNPQPGDCTVVEVCTQGYYSPANAVVPLPDLPSWLTGPAQDACVQQFVSGGGYGEMSVTGQSDECEMVDKVFQHVTYCPLACNMDPNAPGCAGCMPGGGGSF